MNMKNFVNKCKYADKYKGLKPPKCNKGNPCQECINKYKKMENK